MDGQRCDAVSRVLGTRMSRDRALALLAGLVALRWSVASAKDTWQRATLSLTDPNSGSCTEPQPERAV